ncbi:Sensory transduction protein LytR [Arenibacter antarcticus]|uniref:LytTR family DNA-binding domain-containing protein n=1 Tax=Arenibacter antarcticus TaxID=2040469 RepID=A0ABW5VL14_9FLAO|nr:LytTR family DNA-binding domain-containing protein [Arenibacter sp. H213]MCM4167236.1 hypothetical protein [Arenibacter sp. H213]
MEGAKYVSIYTNSGNHLTEQSLAQLEEKLPDYFLRVHRSIIINTNYVENAQKYFNSRYIITLKTKTKSSITTGRSYISQVKSWLNV